MKTNESGFPAIGCDSYFKDRGQCVFKVPGNKRILILVCTTTV